MTEVTLPAGIAAPATDKASFLKRDQSNLVLEQFASIMNQSSGSLFGKGFSYAKPDNDMSKDVFSLGNTDGGVQKDYAKFSQATRTIADAKPETVNAADFSEKVSALAEKVEEAVKETMQVSDEEFAKVMEVLGFSPMDLLNPQNLIQVAQLVSGSTDVGSLLVDANFQLALQEVTGLIRNFQQENGLDAGVFGDLLAQLSAQIDELEETVQEILQTGEASPEQMKQQFDELLEEAFGVETPESMVAVPKEVTEETAAAVQTIVTPEAEQPVVMEIEETEEQTAVPLVTEMAEQAAQSEDGEGEMSFGADQNPNSGKSEKLFSASVEEQMGATEQANLFREPEILINTQAMTQPEVPQAAFTYLEVERLMDQMEGLARAFASAEGTTLEMQLNPESLGRLFLTVTEKQGAVTAQIAASNEQVKEALQTQMVELKATLEAQGLKVEAVEVTVATHEFEQNLDGNASANGQMQQEQAERQAAENGRRNLNLNNLDELSGLMSEEEALVAQMMRDNGGTVDYTA